MVFIFQKKIEKKSVFFKFSNQISIFTKNHLLSKISRVNHILHDIFFKNHVLRPIKFLENSKKSAFFSASPSIFWFSKKTFFSIWIIIFAHDYEFFSHFVPFFNKFWSFFSFFLNILSKSGEYFSFSRGWSWFLKNRFLKLLISILGLFQRWSAFS